MKQLNDKQIKFCEEYVANGYNGSEAYRNSFNTDNLDTCRVNACKLLRLPKITAKVREIQGNYHILGMQMGIDRKLVIRRIKEMMDMRKTTMVEKSEMVEGKLVKNKEVVDLGMDCIAVNNAIVTWAKLTGEFEAEKKQVSFSETDGMEKDPSKMTEAEREEAKQKILSEI